MFLALVGLFLRGKAVLLQFGGLDTQFFHLLLAGKKPRAALHAAAGKAAARVDHLTIQRDHLVVVTVVPRHAGSFVDVVHHDDAAQQVRHDVVIPAVSLHKAGGQPRCAGKTAPEHAGLDGIQRQEGGAACVVIAQQGNGRFGGGFVLHHDVLQSAAKGRFHSHLAAGLHL